MICYPVLFDGHDLGSLFAIEYHMERNVGAWTPNLIEAPSAMGALFGGTQPNPVTITMELYTFAKTRDERQEALRTLSGWLAVDEPKMLQLGDEGGRYRMAVPTDEMPIEAFLNAESVSVSFVCPDPRLYGEEHTVTVPANGSVTFLVGGTAPTMPTVSANVGTSAVGEQWRLALEDGTYLLYESASDAASSMPMTYDCANRIVTRGRNVVMLPPQADWLTFSPGEHTLAMTGDATSGDATVTYREMWW